MKKINAVAKSGQYEFEALDSSENDYVVIGYDSKKISDTTVFLKIKFDDKLVDRTVDAGYGSDESHTSKKASVFVANEYEIDDITQGGEQVKSLSPVSIYKIHSEAAEVFISTFKGEEYDEVVSRKKYKDGGFVDLSIQVSDIKEGARFSNADGTIFIIDKVSKMNWGVSEETVVESSLEGGKKGNYRDEINDFVAFLNEESSVKIFYAGGVVDDRKITSRNWWGQTLSTNEQNALIKKYAPFYSSSYQHARIYEKNNNTIVDIWEKEGSPKYSEWLETQYGFGDLTDVDLGWKIYYKTHPEYDGFKKQFADGGSVTDTTIAKTILQQLGGQGRLNMMTGAYNFVALKNGVSFRIKNPKANFIKITLNSLDLYDVEIGRIRAYKYNVVEKADGVYSDMLKPIIERVTGMYLSLFADGGAVGVKTYRLSPYKQVDGVSTMITPVYEMAQSFEGTYSDAVKKAQELFASNNMFVQVDIIRVGKNVLSNKKIAYVSSLGVIKFEDGGLMEQFTLTDAKIEKIEKALYDTFGINKADGVTTDDIQFVIRKDWKLGVMADGKWAATTSHENLAAVFQKFKERGWKVYGENGGKFADGGKLIKHPSSEKISLESVFANTERFMDYDGRFLYPPRIEHRLQPASINRFDNNTYIAQPKFNGSSTSIAISENTATPKERHNTFFSVPPKFDFKALHRGKGYMCIVGEFMNKSKKDETGEAFKGFVIWDITAYNGKILIGSTIEERIELLKRLYPSNGEIKTNGGLTYMFKTNVPQIFRAANFYSNFAKVYEELIEIDLVEGFVIKRKNGVLSPMTTEKNNIGFSVKIRKPTRNYNF